jgi:hypothetical protein
MRVLAEIIASDVSLLVTFNHAIDGVIQNNPKARTNPKALAQLDGYKRPLVSSRVSFHAVSMWLRSILLLLPSPARPSFKRATRTQRYFVFRVEVRVLIGIPSETRKRTATLSRTSRKHVTT